MNPLMFIQILFGSACIISAGANQAVVDYLAENLQVYYSVIDNFADSWLTYKSELILKNTGPLDILDNNWQLYFCHIRLLEPELIIPNGTLLGDTGFRAFHINGCLHKLEPTSDFKGLLKGATKRVPFKASDWAIARTDIMPNWYVASTDDQAKIISHTADEDLAFVAPFTKPEQYKRQPEDVYNPFTPQERFQLYTAKDLGSAPIMVIPTPVSINTDQTTRIALNSGDWAIVEGHETLRSEALFLSDHLGLPVFQPVDSPSMRYIVFNISDITDNRGTVINNAEAYKLVVREHPLSVVITSTTNVGAFWAIQTLLSLLEDNRGLAVGDIIDFPRFSYRGLMVDVGRNFFPKETIFKLIDAMAMYKLNKLHIHITEDEGWRLEIPDLPELTEVGARSCHSESEDECLFPQLGQLPGSPLTESRKYYTVGDYQDILKYATRRHIEVIPEFDMPSHSHAAITAMEVRYEWYMGQNKTADAEQYRLRDPDDTSVYLTAQHFTDNVMNPCNESTYNFIELIISTVQDLHKNIQPLRIFNFGGDETPEEAWSRSEACLLLNGSRPTKDALKEMFVKRVATIATKYNLSLAGWEDGLIATNKSPLNKSEIKNDDVFVYAWKNVWEWGDGNGAYRLANGDYKVVLSHGTHLYFDHPQEPDPEERGYYWATRFTNIKKVINYMPDDVYANIDVDRMGNKLNKEEICQQMECTELKSDKTTNVIGIQGHIWSETCRKNDHLYHMVFPRMIALAEKAWHKADWEILTDIGERTKEQNVYYEKFVNTLGYKELKRLDAMGIAYRIPPPAAIINDMVLTCTSEYPGLLIRYSVDGGTTFNDYKPDVSIGRPPGNKVLVVTKSADERRESRQVSMTVSTSGTAKPNKFPLLVFLQVFYSFFKYKQ